VKYLRVDVDFLENSGRGPLLDMHVMVGLAEVAGSRSMTGSFLQNSW
jgi:hypothetical protein